MNEFVTIKLHPHGGSIRVPPGTPLRDVLFSYGVEFPCGGHGKCRKCRVRVLEGELPHTEEEKEILTPEDIAAGWRLSCRINATSDATLEVGQWETAILADDTVFSIDPRPGIGIAVDVGTTTLVAQLVDLENGRVLGVQSALNPQATHGGDIMTRIQAALTPAGLVEQTTIIRHGISELIDSLESPRPVTEVVLVGNTAMHHLFCAVDPEPLSRVPFHPEDDGLKTFTAAELNWNLPAAATVQFLPCIGGFVGSDVMAGILACGLDKAHDLTALLDLGTNGEIVIGDRNHLLCASTAAGPAFEGGRISAGMRAATGAIAEAHVTGGRLLLHILGGGKPRGICGSGLVDLAAAGLELNRIQPSGRFQDGAKAWLITTPVKLIQRDIRELQLAKGATAAGVRMLLSKLDAGLDDVAFAYLAGAFGNYVNRESARRIGLIDFPLDIVHPAGNAALLGAKLVLFRTTPAEREFTELRSRIRHVPLADDPAFQDTYVDAMGFPAA
jgi:uncharacterized 2Fe-2S/4Fe-4S cluster protein (DUF4445 family)